MSSTEPARITPEDLDASDELTAAVTELLAHEDPTPASRSLREGEGPGRWERVRAAAGQPGLDLP